MIRLALEVPTAFLRDWTPLTDLDFVLAQRVLVDETYARFYRDRPTGRELILDNGMHELGHPLSPVELRQAAALCRADYVITPDRLGEPRENLHRYKSAGDLLRPDFKVAVVMSGRDPSERALYLEHVKDADMLCLPYREPRLEWWFENRKAISDRWPRVHLLGVSTFEELGAWRRIAIGDVLLMSVDTRKPVKWGMENVRMNSLDTLRGGPPAQLVDDVFSLTCAQRECILWNIGYLRTFL